MTEKYKVDRDNARWKIVDGEVVVINVTNTYYYGLNRTGTFLWGLLCENGWTLDELVHAVANHYTQPADSVRTDVRKILADLLEESLIEKKEES